MVPQLSTYWIVPDPTIYEVSSKNDLNKTFQDVNILLGRIGSRLCLLF